MGGAERQALYLVEHLKGLQGCDVEVLTFHDGDALRPHLDRLGIRPHVLPYYFRWSRARRARAIAHLAWMLRTRIKPDALLPFVGIHSKVIAQAWPYSGARFCWWNQQDEGRDLNGTPEEKRILERVSAITSNSVAGRDFLSRTYGIEPGRIFVYNNGTPLLDRVDASNLESRLKIESRPVVSMVANVTAYKDHATLIDAWAIVRRRFAGSAAPVLLVAGSLSDKATVNRLVSQAFHLGLSASDIVFLGPVDNVAEVMSASDLVVHSSLTEGCPNSVCEAMSLGLPVVATDIAGCRQALGDGASESLSSPRDAAELAERIIRMLEDPALRRATGDRNRERIRADFSIEGMNSFFQSRIEAGLGVGLN